MKPNNQKVSGKVKIHLTNRDKFNSLTNDELVDVIANNIAPCKFCVRDYRKCDYDTICSNYIKEWLESEVE